MSLIEFKKWPYPLAISPQFPCRFLKSYNIEIYGMGNTMSLILMLSMLIGFMSDVYLKKWSCCRVELMGQEPHKVSSQSADHISHP